jgi:hypothetical protein
MSKGGWKGITIEVANKLFEGYSVSFQDRKLEEGCYVAIHPNGQEIRKGRVTECVKTTLESWFTLKN